MEQRAMDMSLVGSLGLLGLVLLAAACGSDAATSSERAAPTATCESLAAAECSWLSRCFNGGLGAARLSESNCKARVALDCETGLLPGMDAASWLSCNTAAYSARCELAINQMNGCARLPGTNPNGAACIIGNQCLSAGCKHVGGATCGTCVTPAAEGQSCGPTPCASGFVCSDGTCVAPPIDAEAKEGDPCSGPSCGGYLRCSAGVCVALEQAGGACDGPGLCDLDLACNGGMCVKVPGVAEGQACKASEECVDGTSCALPESGDSVCATLLEDGEPCDPTFGPSCTFPAVCLNGICSLRAATSSCE